MGAQIKTMEVRIEEIGQAYQNMIIIRDFFYNKQTNHDLNLLIEFDEMVTSSVNVIKSAINN